MNKIHKNNPDTLMYQDYTEGKKHLTFWEEDCEFSTAKEWFNHTVAYKKYLRKYISENGYKSVLDCGAGIGTEYIGLLEDKVKVEYTGIDITPKFVQHMKENGIDAYCCSIENLPFFDNSYDAVICYGVMNHQKDFRNAIYELVRVSNKEVIISFWKEFYENMPVEHSGDFNTKKQGDGIIVERHDKFIYNHFSKVEMEKFLKDQGYNYMFEKIHDYMILFIKKMK